MALSLLRDCKNSGVPVLPLAVNISGYHLLSKELVPYLEVCLKKYELDGECLEIEITEGSLITDIDACIQELGKLKTLGISISIDDFGTGYSALSYLKRLPLDKLKIDRSFVKECHEVTQDLEICATVINLAKSLNLEVVAEGVELKDQVEVLSRLGCDVFQGYYFYHPLEEGAIKDLLLEKIGMESVTLR
jgi:Amt family ammonium transporter